MPEHFMETTNLRIGQLETKVDEVSDKLAEMDAASMTQFAETRELIQDRFTILQDRLEKVDGDIRTDMHEGFRRVRTEMQQGFSALRTEMREGLGSVRTEMQGGLGSVRTDMKDGFERLESKLDRVLATRPARTRVRRRR
jgi:hypothetical protein